MELSCPECSENITIDYCYSLIGDEFTCPKCNAILELNYDEIYNGEEEIEYFWFEIIC